MKSILLIVLLLSFTVKASDPIPNNVDKGHWQLAISMGHGTRTSFNPNEQRFVHTFVPTISYYGEKVFFDNGLLGYTFHENPTYTLSAVTEFNPIRSYFDKNNLLMQLAPLSVLQQRLFNDPFTKDSWALDVGVQLNYFINDYMMLRSQVMRDALDTYNGNRLVLEGSLNVPHKHTGDWRVAINAGIDWFDEATVKHFFITDTSSKHFNHVPDSAFNPHISLTVSRPLNANWSLIFYLKHQRLGEAIANRPESNVDSLQTRFIGLQFRF